MKSDIEKEIPRWLRIPLGIVLGFIAIICTIGPLKLITDPPQHIIVIGPLFGLLLLIVCVWLFIKAVRLAFDINKNKGLMSPTTLKISGIIFLSFPVIGLFTGYYEEKGIFAVIQAFIYIFFCSAMFKLANIRREKNASNKLMNRTKYTGDVR